MTTTKVAHLADFLEALRSAPGIDLETEVQVLCTEYGEELFKLGLAIHKANPSRMVHGPPPGVHVMAELRITGALSSTASAMVRAIRCVRERINSLTLSEAHQVCREIISGKPYVYAPAPLSIVEREAAEWRRGGFSVDVTVVDGTPTEHEQDFRGAVARVATADTVAG